MSLERTVWRIIHLGTQESAHHTAVERAVFEGVSKGTSSPTLLFSTWAPTVSLGRSQSYALDVDAEACKKYGVQIIRRHSGGQAVYLDEGYFVFSAIAHPDALTHDLTQLRKDFCDMLVSTLKEYAVPAIFHEPDNIVIQQGRYQTLGNSGQILRPGRALVAQGSVRHHFGDLDVMLDVLKVNGHKLNDYIGEIRHILTDVRTYSAYTTLPDLTKSFQRFFLDKVHGCPLEGQLMYAESEQVKRFLQEEKNPAWVMGDATYPSRGVCYFFLNGKNLVPALDSILPCNQPSTLRDSTT